MRMSPFKLIAINTSNMRCFECNLSISLIRTPNHPTHTSNTQHTASHAFTQPLFHPIIIVLDKKGIAIYSRRRHKNVLSNFEISTDFNELGAFCIAEKNYTEIKKFSKKCLGSGLWLFSSFRRRYNSVIQYF